MLLFQNCFIHFLAWCQAAFPYGAATIFFPAAAMVYCAALATFKRGIASAIFFHATPGTGLIYCFGRNVFCRRLDCMVLAPSRIENQEADKETSYTQSKNDYYLHN
jgi:hypothetical protein